MAASFVPKGQEGLLLRSPLTNGLSPHATVKLPKPIYTKDTERSRVLGAKDRETLMKKTEKLAFYTRNNPHPVRVSHMKGLLDVPVCRVEDNTERRYLLSPPTGQDFSGYGYVPQGNTRYSANINKGIAAIGVVPVTQAWRDELERKTQEAILRAMGHPVQARGVTVDTQTGERKERMFDNLQDEKLLELLCKILQTDSIPACLAWLSMASETEKSIVMNMIKMAACGEFQDVSTRPHTADTQTRYIWAPKRSRTHDNKKSYAYSDDHHNHGYSQKEWERYNAEKLGGLSGEMAEDPPFKLPENDTIIRTAHQLSRLASRNSSRAGAAGLKGLEKDADINKVLAKKLNEKDVRGKRQRSATLPLPANRHGKGAGQGPGVQRARSRSVSRDILPPIPSGSKASVTKETISGGASGSARLRYTSHWEA